MPYLVPPMPDEPPVDFVEFVAVRLADAQRQAARLTGGPEHADEIYPMALSDVAGRWRRLRLRRRLAGRDPADEFLARRVAVRAKQWRDEQIYEVEMHVLRAPAAGVPHCASIAERKAAVLPATGRAEARPVAEAGIAWVHAYRRYRYHVVARTVAGALLYLVALTEIAQVLPG